MKKNNEISAELVDQANADLQIAKSELKKALANKQNVVWDATNLRIDFRKQIFDFLENEILIGARS